VPKFNYTIKDKSGKTITGSDEAVDQATLVTRLQQQGFFILSVQSQSKISPSRTEGGIKKRTNFSHNTVTLDDLLTFCRQMSTMLNTGVTLLRSLDIISMQVDSKQFHQILLDVKRGVEEGNSLSSSLAKHPRVFSKLWVSLVEVGEASGNLPNVLEKLAFYLEQQAAFKSAVISAIIYPVILLVVAVGAILFFALVIGPRFKSLFDSFGVELPIITRVLLGLFDFIKTKFLLLIAIAGVILFAIRKYSKTPLGQRQYEAILFSLPKVGYVFRTIVVERFTSQMSILVDSGVPILYALDITQRMVNNKTCEEVIADIKKNVREGKLIAQTMMTSGFFPPMAVQMILVGEESGELAKMLRSVAEYYQNYVQTFMKRFGTIFEPLMLVVMGGAIGIIVIAMFLPIFSIANMGR